MATTTPNFGLRKPAVTGGISGFGDPVNAIADIGDNMVIIDNELKEAQDTAALVGHIIARGNRPTSSTVATSTTDVGALRLDSIPVIGGRLYEIVYDCAPNSSINTDTTGVRVRFTTNNTAAGIASPVLPSSDTQGLDDCGPRHKAVMYAPGVNQILSLLLCARRLVGTGQVNLFADGADRNTEMWVIDRGIDPGDTGVDV